VQCLLVLPMMMPWPPGQWFHGALAIVFAAAVAWCAWRLWSSRAAALLVAAATLSFPGVWHWSLSNVNLWPSLLALAALACLIEGRIWAAAAASLAAAALGASLPPVAAAVAWAFIFGPGSMKEASDRAATPDTWPLAPDTFFSAARSTQHAARFSDTWPLAPDTFFRAAARQPRRMRIAGLLFVAATLLLVRLVSPESNIFHSFRSVTMVVDPQQWLPQLGLLAVLALAGALAGAPAFAVVYAASALASAMAGGDSRLWLELGAALTLLAAGALRLRKVVAWKVTAAAAVFVQLALLSPFPLWLSPAVDAQQLRYIYATVARSPDPVLSEDVGPLAAARKPALVSDPYAARLAQKYFPEEPLLEQLRAGRISQVVTMRDPTAPDFPAGDSDPVWSERMIRELRANYRKTREYDIGTGQRYYFFAPKSRQAAGMSYRSSVISRQ